ncbi:MAG: VapB-type antitoxin [Nitrososphaerota archaeon]|jgi:bifunctional DNA-binding transcriptional regulator/antitoxin component of YhaV-PrlF toxin-antitoxin module|nr:VapB-type antitoxin [Nitrososphaerota archaeon]
MSQVSKVDDRGRITLPKGIAEPGNSVVIVYGAEYFFGIPIRDPLKDSSSWLKADEKVKALKKAAEAAASRDAHGRAERRGQG